MLRQYNATLLGQSVSLFRCQCRDEILCIDIGEHFIIMDIPTLNGQIGNMFILYSHVEIPHD